MEWGKGYKGKAWTVGKTWTVGNVTVHHVGVVQLGPYGKGTGQAGKDKGYDGKGKGQAGKGKGYKRKGKGLPGKDEGCDGTGKGQPGLVHEVRFNHDCPASRSKQVGNLIFLEFFHHPGCISRVKIGI